MLCGEKFKAVNKHIVAQSVSFSPSILDDNETQITAFINAVDSWAQSFGYEYHSMTATCIVFKRIY